ncbi:MAG: N-6 DNA methylase [Candidatus Helarchaeota archaeon]
MDRNKGKKVRKNPKKNINEHITEFITNLELIIIRDFLPYTFQIYEKNEDLYFEDPEKYDNFEIFKFWEENSNHLDDSEDLKRLIFCKESIIILLNKILLLKICQDKGIFSKSIEKIQFYGENSFFKMDFPKTPFDLIIQRISEMGEPLFNYSALDWVNRDRKLDLLINKVIKYFDNFSFKNLDQDILGYIYEKIMSNDKKKSLGQFYTPTSIIDYILEKTGYNSNLEIENIKIIDPCCGAGSFLVRAIRILIDRYKIKYETEKLLPLQAKNLLQCITNKINGIDINPFACFLTIMNIFFQIIEYYYIVMDADDSYWQYPFHVFNIDVLDLCISDSKMNINETDNNENNDFFDSFKSDIVVGNPPYIFLRDLQKSEKNRINSLNLASNKGQWDLYQIFVEIGIKLLKDGGCMGYIVPDSILTNSHKKNIRKYIYENCNIKIINHVGKKFKFPAVSNVILILEKPKKVNPQNKIQLIISNETNTINEIKQNKIKENWDYNFYLHLSKEDEKIIEKLKQYPSIDEINKNNPDIYIKIHRGVELSKKGLIFYCSKCKKFHPLPEKENVCRKCGTIFKPDSVKTIIHDNKITRNCKLFVSDMNRYVIQKYLYIEIDKHGINYKFPEIYIPNRIIVRQLSQNGLICATIEPKGAYTSQSIYNIDTNLNPYYLLGLINSKLMSYYFSKIFGSYKSLFPRILVEYIKKLPIIIPNKEEEKKIEIIIKKILNIHKENLSKQERNKCILDLQPQIDSIVYNLFGLDMSDKLVIRNFFNKTNKSQSS